MRSPFDYVFAWVVAAWVLLWQAPTEGRAAVVWGILAAAGLLIDLLRLVERHR
jgi:hypothetical protein